MPSDAARQTIISQLLSKDGPKVDVAAEIEKQRRHITIMFTDIKGSTAYFEKYGDAAGLMMVNECCEMQQKSVEKFGGAVIKTIGDAVMAKFENAEQGVLATMEMQRELVKRNQSRPEQDRVAIRIGLNYGPGIVKHNDVFGDVVNVASRVESAAQPDQILISDTLQQQVVGTTKFKTRHVGKFAFKGKGEERDVFEVIWNPLAAAQQPQAAHTVVRASSKVGLIPNFKLEHIEQDGSVGAAHFLKEGTLKVGRKEGDLKFAADTRMAGLHARFYTEKGQLYVEDVSKGNDVFIRLVGPYCLLDGDVVKMGSNLFEFHAKDEALSAAAATGTTIVELASWLNGAAAEFHLISQASPDENTRFPLIEERTTWGRRKGTFIFPEDNYMSRSHAVVYLRGEDFFLEDLGSRNGTYIKVRGTAPVPTGSSVMIGGQLFRVGFE